MAREGWGSEEEALITCTLRGWGFGSGRTEGKGVRGCREGFGDGSGGERLERYLRRLALWWEKVCMRTEKNVLLK